MATAAIRQASNREELCAAIERAAGVPVEVLSGEDEARLAFVGATKTLRQAPEGEVAVVDVGGGSTEVVCGTVAGGVTWSNSFRVGSGFLADHYLHGDPPAASELDEVRAHVAGVFEGLEPPPVGVAYAVGGSATSLRRLIGAVLDHETLGRGIRVLSGGPAGRRWRGASSSTSSARVCCRPGCCCSTRPACCSGCRCRSPAAGLREGVILERLAAHDAEAA